MNEQLLTVSGLPKTWILDIDGVILRHNGYRVGKDALLPGVREFWNNIGPDDIVIIVSARHSSLRDATINKLAEHGLRIDYALFGLPVGERILINDNKPSGLVMGHAVNLTRDIGLGNIIVNRDENL